MANYIKNEVLCEAYSHLDVSIADDPQALEKLKLSMLEFFSARASFLFGDDVHVEIEFEEGSLITRLKVVGSAAAILLVGLNTYGSFRQTIDYLVKDSTLLAQSANLEMVFRTKAAFCDRVRIEKRRGIFGRVDELITHLDAIKRDVEQSRLPRNQQAIAAFSRETTDKLIAWDADVKALIAKFDHEDTKACVVAGMLEELEKFPSTAPWENDIEGSSFRAEVARSDPEKAGLLTAAATRYKVTVKGMLRSYGTLVQQYAPKTA